MRLDVRVTGNDRHIRQKPCGGTQAVMAWITLLFLSFFCFVSMPPAALHAAVLETKYATIIYDDPLILGEFNSSLGMLGLGYSVRDKDLRSINDQARDKVDVIIERVRRVLKMRDTNLKFRMVLLPTAREVRKVFRSRYGGDTGYKSFYAPREKTVYLSLDDLNRRMFAHEVAHAVIGHHYKVPLPVRTQEELAGYADTHFDD